MIIFIILGITLFLTELSYLKIADKFGIIDNPNHRSLHDKKIVRGGGIIFFISSTIYFLFHDFDYPFFFLGLTIVSIISFIDDIKSLPNYLRFLAQACSVGLLFIEINSFNQHWGVWLIIVWIISVGILNAYNFMDGINGITAGYSFITILTLYVVNQNIHFAENDFMIYILISVIVFSYFNFRKKAKCFAGDVGSISIAFIIIFLSLRLIFQTNNYIYVLFLTFYGIDTILTIIERVLLQENIFEAHKKHFFQLLVYKSGFSHLQVSLIYMIIQTLINAIVLFVADKEPGNRYFLLLFLLGLIILYILVKKKIIRNTLTVK